MSLIEEALRKQQEDAATRDKTATPAPAAHQPHAKPTSGSPPTATPVPPPLPPQIPPRESAPGAKAAHTRRVVLLVSLLVLLLLVLAGAAFFVYRARQAAREVDAASEQASTPPQPVPAPPVDNVASDEVAAIAPAAVEPVAGEALPAVGTDRVSAVTAPVPATPATGAVSATGGPTVTEPAARTGGVSGVFRDVPLIKKLEAVASVRAKPAVKPVAWPSLRLTGFMGARNAGRGAALINGRVVEAGELIEGVTVLMVRRDGVELEYQGERRFLKQNAPIE